MKTALGIINKCDILSITEDDKQMIVAVCGTIIKELKEKGFVPSTESKAQYAILKESMWDDGYFCTATRQMCSVLYPIVNLLHKVFEQECKANGLPNH